MSSCVRVVLVVLVVAVWATAAGAVSIEGIPNPRQRDGTWVTDQDALLAPSDVYILNRTIGDLNRTCGVEVAVVTIDQTDGQDAKPFATALFNRWGLGQAGVNNGVLVLVVMGQRAIEVEVGDGARAAMPDAWVVGMIETRVLRHFKAGNPAAGIKACVDAIAARLRSGGSGSGGGSGGGGAGLEDPPDASSVARPAASYPGLAERAADLPWGWGLLGFIPGGWWLKRWLRRRPRSCAGCGNTMMLLDETADDTFLNKAQVTEEFLGSVDYDVWVCPRCNQSHVEQYKAWLSSYYQCPSCKAQTLDVTHTTITAATYDSTGTGRKTSTCKNCGHNETSTYTISRKTRSHSHSSSSHRSSSSSSSSSSSRSFGGGRSSGGGGGGRW